MTVEIFEPDADVETSSVDGFVGRLADGAWATIRGSAGDQSSDAAGLIIDIAATTTTDVWDFIRRSIMLFDISSIPVGQTIQGVALEARPTTVPQETLAGQSIVVVSASPATDTALVDADYNVANFGMATPLSDTVTLASLTDGLPFFHIFNADGVAHVQTAADGDDIVKLGHVMESDRADVEPTWGSADVARIQLGSAEESPGDTPYRLIVTYGDPAAGAVGSVGGGGGGAVMLSI